MAKSPTARTSGADGSNMVLRTFYLSVELDEKLKTAALLVQRSKNDVIRELITSGLAEERTPAARAYGRARRRPDEAVKVASPVRVKATDAGKDAGDDAEWRQLVAEAAEIGKKARRAPRSAKAAKIGSKLRAAMGRPTRSTKRTGP